MNTYYAILSPKEPDDFMRTVSLPHEIIFSVLKGGATPGDFPSHIQSPGMSGKLNIPVSFTYDSPLQEKSSKHSKAYKRGQRQRAKWSNQSDGPNCNKTNQSWNHSPNHRQRERSLLGNCLPILYHNNTLKHSLLWC